MTHGISPQYAHTHARGMDDGTVSEHAAFAFLRSIAYARAYVRKSNRINRLATVAGFEAKYACMRGRDRPSSLPTQPGIPNVLHIPMARWR